MEQGPNATQGFPCSVIRQHVSRKTLLSGYDARPTCARFSTRLVGADRVRDSLLYSKHFTETFQITGVFGIIRFTLKNAYRQVVECGRAPDVGYTVFIVA